jgi:hypothetical protein
MYFHFVYPLGKPMKHHLLCYQGLAVVDYGFTLDASDLAHPRLSINRGLISLFIFTATWNDRMVKYNAETFEKCSFLFKFKKGEIFNRRSTYGILRIKN